MKNFKKLFVFFLILTVLLPCVTLLSYTSANSNSGWVRVDDKDPSITYTGKWEFWDGRGAGTYMDTETYSADVNGGISFTFTGSKIRVISKKDPMQGAARITIDDGEPVDVDCYSEHSSVQVIVFESPLLEMGEHTIKMQPLERRGLCFSLDAFEYLTMETTIVEHKNTNDIWTKLDDNDPSVKYSEGWSVYPVTGSYGGSVHASDVKGAAVTFTFTGTKARFYGAKKDFVGIASVYVDGEYQTHLDCKDGQVNSYDYMLYETPLLPYGQHTLTLNVLRLTSGGGEDGSEIIVDAFSYTNFDYGHTISYQVENLEESGFGITGKGVSVTENGILFDHNKGEGGREAVLSGPATSDIPYGKYKLDIYATLNNTVQGSAGSNIILGLDVQDTNILNENIAETAFIAIGSNQILSYEMNIPMSTKFNLRFWWDKTNTILIDKVVLIPIKPDPSNQINVQTTDPGREYEGIGALSASSSNLLYDYEEPYRSDILDYLFKPNFGAAYQHFKVEMGGDGNSTNQTEPAYARTLEEFELVQKIRRQCEDGTVDRTSKEYLKVKEYFNRGVEFWLMTEAKKRNPDILLDVLQWSAPGWFRYDGSYGAPANIIHDYHNWKKQKFYTQDNADYIASYIWGAREFHELDIDFCGLWNENYNPDRNDWIITLRNTLNRYGLTNVKIIAAEANHWPGIWDSAKDLTATPELREAVHAIGVHYPNWGSPNPYHNNSEAQALGKPLYSSEDGSIGGSWEATLKSARIFNANYIENRIVKTVFWSSFSGTYDGVAIFLSGALKANTPWSGYYEIEDGVWGFAHTSQFTKPGWNYIDNASGYLNAGGTYVTLQDNGKEGNRKTNPDYSIIVETGGASETQTIDVSLQGMSGSNVIVWKTERGNTFQKIDSITPVNGKFSYQVEKDCIYTFSTTTGQQKGTETVIPEQGAFPTDYEENFDGYQSGERPKYFSDQMGGFEIYDNGNSDMTLRQSVPSKPICWWNDYEPFTFVGNMGLRNYTVSADVKIEQSGYGALYGRVTGPRYGQTHPFGYGLRIQPDGKWSLTKYKDKGNKQFGTYFEVLKSGTVSKIGDSWTNLKLVFRDNRIHGFINNRIVFEYTDTANSYIAGRGGLGSSYDYVQFNNFKIVNLDNDNDSFIKVDDTHESVSYSDGWSTWPGVGYHNIVHYIKVPVGNETVTFTFEGVRGRFYGFKRNNLGIADIYVDGVKTATIDQYMDGNVEDVLLYETEVLEYGRHTIQIVPKARKNPLSSGTEIVVDAFSYSTVPPVSVPAEAIQLNETECSLQVNQTYQLLAVVSPDNATNVRVKWESSDPEVVSVDEAGVLTAHKAGSAVITASTADTSAGLHKAECHVTVADIDYVTVSGGKTWIHKSNAISQQPKAITILVKAGDTVVKEKVITAESGWKWSFELPKFDDNGDEIVYTIDEKNMEGYSKTIHGYDIVNTYIEVENPVDPPDTGDRDSSGFMLGIMAMAATMFAIINIQLHRKKIR